MSSFWSPSLSTEHWMTDHMIIRIHINKLKSRRRQQDDPFRTATTDLAKHHEKCLPCVTAGSLVAIKTRSQHRQRLMTRWNLSKTAHGQYRSPGRRIPTSIPTHVSVCTTIKYNLFNAGRRYCGARNVFGSIHKKKKSLWIVRERTPSRVDGYKFGRK